MSDQQRRPTLGELSRQATLYECAKCGCADTRVTNTWHTKEGTKRRRVCRNCGTFVAETVESRVD